jgi:hypothetical protein
VKRKLSGIKNRLIFNSLSIILVCAVIVYNSYPVLKSYGFVQALLLEGFYIGVLVCIIVMSFNTYRTKKKKILAESAKMFKQ